MPDRERSDMHVQGDDPELEAIRQRRMQEIMAQQGGQVCLNVDLIDT